MFEEAGFEELRLSRSTFVLLEDEKDAEGNPRTCACCNLHVDDGFLAGDQKSPTFQRAFEKLKGSFNVKAWIDLQKQGHKYLGLEIHQEEDFTLVESMKRYITETVKPIPVKRGDKPDRRLTPQETTAFRSLTMQLRWPAQKVLSQVLYGVSALAQRVNEACVSDLKEVNRLAELAVSEAEAGRAERVYRAVDLSCPAVVTYLDASLGKETGCRSQAGMMSFVTSGGALTQPTVANIVEQLSSKITRVVRSSLAAEAAAFSLAVDRHLHARLLLQVMMTGEKAVDLANWRQAPTVKGYCVTDARSMYDHVNTTGSIPSERTTMMDLLAAKELVEQALIILRWVPTQHQYADHLTKSMTCELLKRHLETGRICLIQTGADRIREEHKASLRRGQRVRRKARMKGLKMPEANFTYKF